NTSPNHTCRVITDNAVCTAPLPATFVTSRRDSLRETARPAYGAKCAEAPCAAAIAIVVRKRRNRRRLTTSPTPTCNECQLWGSKKKEADRCESAHSLADVTGRTGHRGTAGGARAGRGAGDGPVRPVNARRRHRRPPAGCGRRRRDLGQG